MEKFNQPVDKSMDLVTGSVKVRQDQEDDRQQPSCTNRLPLLDPFLLQASFDISSCLPETPFYDAPFTDVSLGQEIACSSSYKELNQHALLSSPSKSATPSPPLLTTLLSERRRRVSMKERLLALRSLVPNITKMDKASIVGDAVIYVQQLKKEAVELTQEIDQLAHCLREGEAAYRPDEDHIPNQDNIAEKEFGSRKIVQMTLVRIEDCEFFLKISCNRAKGVVVGLLQVLESVEHVVVQSSNFTVERERINLSFTIHVGSSVEINEVALKSSLLSKLAKHGFDTPAIL